MSPKRKCLTEEKFEKGLSDIEGVASDGSDNEEDVQVWQRIGQMIDFVSEYLNEGDNKDEIQDDEGQGEEEYTYDFSHLKKNRKMVTECAM